jgi:hypothetical protein
MQDITLIPYWKLESVHLDLQNHLFDFLIQKGLDLPN